MYPDLLFIPVHKGGDFLTQALESLLPILHNFPRVIISLNSPDNRPDRVRILETLGGDRDNVEIFETPQVFTAAGHLKWVFSDRLMRSSAENLMLFFHDDRIDSAKFDQFTKQNDLTGGAAYFGGWRVSQNGIEGGLSQLQIDPDGESPTDWFTREDLSRVKIDTYTNASGLIVPMASMLNFVNWVPLTRGARFEHMLVSHRSVKVLKTVDNPFVILSRHADQDGANVPLIQSLTDEVIYQVWLFVNMRRCSAAAIWFGGRQLLLATASFVRQSLIRWLRGLPLK